MMVQHDSNAGKAKKSNLFLRLLALLVTAALVLGALLVIHIINKDEPTEFKMSWIIIICLLPVLGALIYLLVVGNFGGLGLKKRLQECAKETEGLVETSKETGLAITQSSKQFQGFAYYMEQTAGFPVYHNSKAVYFPSGEEKFRDLLEELKKAEKFIFLEYFIVEPGIMWNAVLDILKEKVKEGVEVRVMYDGMCSILLLPYGYPEELKGYGIKAKMFSPIRPFLSTSQNNRDHRKICVIDGWTGFTGGINLADEYINQRKRFGRWKDTAVMLKGEGVWNMTAMFLYMWGIVTRTDTSLDFGNYVPHRWHPNEFPGNGYVQPFCDSPLDDEIVGENVYLNIINRAKNYVYICTPYLIIDNEMMTALCLAAKSGVDVRIMTPGIPDKKMVFLLTQSYYKQLLEAGVKIYEYQPGFLHAKSFVCDDKVGVVGTINLDYRSLYLHFEDGVWMYKNDVILDIRDDFTETLEYCDPIDLAFCQKRNIVVRAIQNVLRVFAPLL